MQCKGNTGHIVIYRALKTSKYDFTTAIQFGLGMRMKYNSPSHYLVPKQLKR